MTYRSYNPVCPLLTFSPSDSRKMEGRNSPKKAFTHRHGPGMLLCLCAVLLLPGRIFAEREVRLDPEGEHLRPVKYGGVEISGRVPESLPEIYLLRPDLHTLKDLVQRLNAAAVDRSIDGVIVRMGRFGGGWGKAREVRNAISNIAGAGKETIVFLERAGNLEYYIASGADRVVMPPAGSLMLTGLRGEVMFLKGLLDKVGVKADFLQVGDYKGAADPFVDKSASEKFKDAAGLLFDSLFDQFAADIAEGRGLEPESVIELVDSGPYTTSGALRAGLIDDVKFHHELLKELREKEEAPFEYVSDYAREEITAIPLGEGTQRLMKILLGMRAELRREVFPEGNVIAIVNMVGPVVMERPETALLDDSVVDARLVVRILQELRDKPNVAAVVLRIESPGGDAQAADLIWEAVRETDRAVPVVTSISDVAGSGGYYIACAGRYVFASEGSMTGSIGVVGGKFVVKDLFDKLGINVEVFERGRHSGLFSPIETFSESQRERFRHLLENTYDTFLGRVADARGMSGEKLSAAAGGRPLTGIQALEMGLIDEAGGLHEAIAYARELAGIGEDEDITVISLPKPQSLLDAILTGRDIGVNYPPGLLERGRTALLPEMVEDGFRYLHAVSLMGDYRPATLMPAMIRIR